MSEQDWWAVLEEALDSLEEASVDWYKECEQDTKDGGWITGDGKEKRRARKWVMNVVKELAAASPPKETINTVGKDNE